MFTSSIKTASLVLAALTAAAGTATHATAAITAVSGNTTWLGSPPASAMPGALAGNNAFTWNEQSGVLLSNLTVNILGSSGTYTGNTPYLNSLSGTFDSHFIHFDNASGIAFVNGSVTFSTKIVAVIYQDALLNISDPILGSFGTVYPTNMPGRSYGPALGATSITLATNTLFFNIFANAAAFRLEELRVITEHAVPAPGALALVGMGGLVMARRRR